METVERPAAAEPRPHSAGVTRSAIRHPRLLAAALFVAVAGSLLAFQPLRSPWWSGYDFDSVYVGNGLTLFRGERSVFYDHPGAPLQEALAATFTAAWALGSPSDSRDARAAEWAANLDTTRSYLRTWGSIFYVASGLLVLAVVAWVTGSALLGLVGGLLFLGAPDVLAWAAVIKPDALMTGLTFAAVGLAVMGVRRRSGALFLASGFVLGAAVSVKLQAAAGVVPLGLALLLGTPPDGWAGDLRRSGRRWIRAHRAPLLAAAGVWLVLVVALNVLAAPPDARDGLRLVAGLAVLVAAGFGASWLARGRRLSGLVDAVVGCSWAFVAGTIVPNLLYASVPAPMLKEVLITLTGGGVNTGAHPALEPWQVLGPWRVMALLAAIGLLLGLRTRPRETLVWASGSLALGFLAYLRYGDVHYYTVAVTLAIPLALEPLRELLVRRRRALAVGAAALAVWMVYTPLRTGIDLARGRQRDADRTERVDRWVEARLHPGEVALTRLESSDGRYFHIVRFYAPGLPHARYRFLPPDDEAARYIRDQGLRVRFVVTGAPADAGATLRDVGVSGRTVRAAAPGYVYRVLSKTAGAASASATNAKK
jgi:hypothetical protein